MLDYWSPLPASLLAIATTAHVALTVLRKQRSPAGTFPWAIVPSIALSASPWVFPTVAGVALGAAAHAVWFAACEALIPKAIATPLRAAAAMPPARPVASSAATFATSAARPKAGACKQFVPASVLAVLDESPTIRTFRLARPEGFTFTAGQFLTVRVLVDGVQHVRCYSISSAPETPGYLEISVKRQGLVSGMLHATVRAGSTIMVRPPAGKFTYPANDDRPVVLIAGGVGITPMISMLRHAVAAEPLRPVTLLYSARGERELAFGDELKWLERRHAHVRVIPTLTEAPATWTGRVGRIDAALLADCAGIPSHAVFMICGPTEMIESVRHSLVDALGVPASQVRSEVFQAATAVGARPQPGETEEADEPAASGAPKLRLVKSDRTVDIDPRQTLLEAAESANAPIPSLCRSGVCGTCRTRLVSGEVRCSSDALDDDDRADGYTLPCVAFAKTDCSLDA